jgi:ABC-type multidrug transport system fused ATPase/permease subunit
MLPSGMRWRWVTLVPLTIATSLIEAGAAAAVFALIKVISDPSQISRIPIVSAVVAALGISSPRSQVIAFTAIVIAYYLFKNLLAAGAQYLSHKIVGESIAVMRSGLLNRYLAAPYTFHLGRNSSDLIWKITFGIGDACGGAMSAAVAASAEILTVAAISIVLLLTAPEITLIVGGLLLAVLAAVMRLTRQMAVRFGGARALLDQASLKTLQQAFGGVREIKAFGREGFFSARYAEQQNKLVELGYVGKTLETLTPLVTETIFVCGAGAVIALVSDSGHSEAGRLPLLALFSYAAFRIVPSINRIAWRVAQMRASSAPVAELYDDWLLLNAELQERASTVEFPPVKFVEAITLDQVSYAFPAADTPVLRDVSLTVRFGESVGILGPTGMGKTTLLDLLVGLLTPSSGRILIDGSDLSEHLSAWKRKIGYVPQSIFLIDDSVRRNVALGIADDAIDQDRVWAVLRLAQIDRFVAGLPKGLDAPIGERGVRLSGGERQRLGIARALYHDPDLLVFDEATSALDSATEAAFTEAIDTLRGSKTILVVAQRLSAVRRCDRLVFVSGGRVGSGSSADELSRNFPEFQRMVSAG